ncbi:MAG: hypothetical protein HYV35_09830, partial [Lentisphaerae bacterium]|nr:hypothetical protein [Lentisphaerota bacterium]
NIYSALTNAAQPTGALVTVGGLLAVTNGSAVYPYSHATNGGSPIIFAATILVDSNSSINADYTGCGSYKMTIGSSQRGWGWGGGLARQGNVTYGASHGGTAAANSLAVYGSSNAPINPGSGGGANSSTVSGFGGGVINLQAESGSVTINGTLSARGRGYPSGQCLSGGSGGSIYIRCRSFSGSGTLRADGGSGGGDGTYNGYGSAGGRIAVWRMYHSFVGSATATGGAYNTSSAPYAGNGTIVWGQIPVPGTTVRMW